AKKGLKPLLRKAYNLVQTTPKFVLYTPEKTEEVVYNAKELQKPKFKIMKLSPNHYRIEGERVLKAYNLINHKTDEGMMKLLSYLNSIGVDDELRKLGARDGSSVMIGDFEFEYYN
ncbi:MAG: Obg family GTPase CgtA, partial [Bacilli bacterium]